MKVETETEQKMCDYISRKFYYVLCLSEPYFFVICFSSCSHELTYGE